MPEGNSAERLELYSEFGSCFDLFKYMRKSPSQISPILLHNYIIKNDILTALKVLSEKSQISCQLEKTVAK